MGSSSKGSSTGRATTPVRPFEQNKPFQEVAGESHHFAAIQGLFPPGGSGEITADVNLIHDPGNKFDKNAVEVRGATGLLGFLPREDAAIYAPILAQLQANGAHLVTDALVYGWLDEDWESGRHIFRGSVRVTLPQPHLLFPINGEPERPYVLLPYGNAMQVSGEDKHMNELGPYLRKMGEAWVYATVDSAIDEAARTPKTVVSVRIDDTVIGTLGKASGEHLVPVINYLADKGIRTAVHALVRGNALKADVTLYVKKAGELDMEWLERVATNPTYEQAVSLAIGGSSGAVPEDRASGAPAPGAPVSIPESSAATRTTLPPADWYPDPIGEKRLRYWDGLKWTDHLAD